MKNALNAIALLAFITLTSAAHAETENYTVSGLLVSEITEMNLEPAHFGSSSFQAGKIILDRAMLTITLTLKRAMVCPEHQLCAQVMPLPVRITLPIMSVEKNGCGATVYTAHTEINESTRTVQTLQITDNAHQYCNTLIPVAAVEGQYTVEAVETLHAIHRMPVSTFSGKAFHEIR